MTLPVSGAISFNAINVELAVAGTTTASLGQASYRTLAGVPSGAISLSNFYGKSNRGSASTTLAGGANVSLNVTSLSGYVAGNTTITITISGICYGSGGTPGLTLTGGSGTDTISIVNNSYITGSAGAGAQSTGGSGGPALSLGWPVTITNNGYIGGGGGGGGGASPSGAVGLGGNGAGGNSSSGSGSPGVASSGSPYSKGYGTGGGGGWGGNGGTGYGTTINGSYAGTAGSGGGAGGNGGNGVGGGPTVASPGGAGGKAINLNGRTVTWGGPGQVRVYGGIS